MLQDTNVFILLGGDFEIKILKSYYFINDTKIIIDFQPQYFSNNAYFFPIAPSHTNLVNGCMGEIL